MARAHIFTFHSNSLKKLAPNYILFLRDTSRTMNQKEAGDDATQNDNQGPNKSLSQPTSNEEEIARLRQAIEEKYGLKSMTEVRSAEKNTSEALTVAEEKRLEKRKEEIRRSHLMKLRGVQAIEEIKQEVELWNKREEEKNEPDIYQHLDKIMGTKSTRFNDKWLQQVDNQLKQRNEMERAMKHGGLFFEAYRKGKLGIDKYVLLFGIFGAAILPIFFWQRKRNYMKQIQEERGVRKEDEANIDWEYYHKDIDDISYHKKWSAGSREERLKSIEKLRRQIMIHKLEQELDGR